MIFLLRIITIHQWYTVEATREFLEESLGTPRAEKKFLQIAGKKVETPTNPMTMTRKKLETRHKRKTEKQNQRKVATASFLTFFNSFIEGR